MILLDDGPDLADGLQLGLHKGLAAEAGLHSHDQHHIQLFNIGQDGVGRGDGPQGHRLFYPTFPHDLQGLGDVGGVVGLQMDGQQVGSGLGEVLDVPHRLVDHQMDVQKHVCTLADGLYYRDANGKVGDKAAVHHIHMEIVRGRHFFDVPLQIDKIGGQNRGSDLYHG